MPDRISTRNQGGKPRKQRGTLVQFPSPHQPKSERFKPEDVSSQTHLMLTDALRAKEDRLNELVQDRERFIHDLQGCVLHSLYAIQSDLNPAKSSGEHAQALHIPAGPVRRRVNALIRAVRDKIFSLEQETATGFELEAELCRLVAVCRHFRDIIITLSIDPYTASLLTREESRYLLHIAQAVTFDSVRRSQATGLTISLSHRNGQILFRLIENGRRAGRGSDADEMGLKSIPAQARCIGGHLVMRAKPFREISVVLDFGPERPRTVRQDPPVSYSRADRAAAKTLNIGSRSPSFTADVVTQKGVFT